MLDTICDFNVQAAETLTGYIKGEIPQDQLEPFQQVQDPFLALTRVTRAIQTCLLLQERFDEDDAAREKRIAEEKAARERAVLVRQAQAEAEEERYEAACRKHQIKRALERAINAAVPPGPENTDYVIELDRLLDDLDRFEDLTEGPVSAIVGRLCRDLSLPVEPELWEDEPWAIEEAAAAAAEAASEHKYGPELGPNDALAGVVRPRAVGNGHDPP